MNVILDESLTERDEVVTFFDFKVVFDKKAIPYLQNTKLDFTYNVLGEGNFTLIRI